MGRCACDCFSSVYLFLHGLCLTIAAGDLILGIIGVIISGRFLADLKMDNGTIKEFLLQKNVEVQFPSYIAIITFTVIQVASWLEIIFSSVLIHGIHKRSNTLMTVWMMSKVIFISLLLIVIALITISSCEIPPESLPFLPTLVPQLNFIWCIPVIQFLKTENKREAQVLANAKLQNNQIQIRNNEIQMKKFTEHTTLCVQMIQDLKDLNKSQLEAEILTKSKVLNNQIQNNKCNNLPENTP